MNGGNMSKEKLISVVIPKQHPKTITHCIQLKNFVDASIKEAINQKDEEKAVYLFKVLFQVRDYLFAEISENSLRIQIIEEMRRLEEEERQAKESLGNPNSVSEELGRQNEILGQDQRDYVQREIGDL